MGYTDKEKAASYAREWRAKHADKVREDDRKRREEERERDPHAASERVRKWRAANPDQVKVQARIQTEQDTLRRQTDPVFRERQKKKQADYLAKPGVRDKRNKYTREWHREQRAKDPNHYRGTNIKSLYGITYEQYEAMVTAQEGKCAICRTDKPSGKGTRWHIDHCHKRDQVRELLCHACNTGLGAFKDQPDLLRAAAAYLEKHQPLTLP